MTLPSKPKKKSGCSSLHEPPFSYLQLLRIYGSLSTEMYLLIKYFEQETTVIAGEKEETTFLTWPLMLL